MRRGVYINNRDIGDFGAKLQTDYSISGASLENTTNRIPSRSSALLLRQDFGPLTITLPLDILGEDKAQVMDNLAALLAQLTGTYEVNLSDGYAYACTLSEVGETAWACDELCSVDIIMTGYRHKEPVTVQTPTATLRVYNPGTWPLTDCVLTIKNLKASGSGTVNIAITGIDIGRRNLLIQWSIDPSSGLYAAGGDLVLDGQQKRNLYNNGAPPSGSLSWTDYPHLVPGWNTITITGAASIDGLQVDFTPTYL